MTVLLWRKRRSRSSSVVAMGDRHIVLLAAGTWARLFLGKQLMAIKLHYRPLSTDPGCASCLPKKQAVLRSRLSLEWTRRRCFAVSAARWRLVALRPTGHRGRGAGVKPGTALVQIRVRSASLHPRSACRAWIVVSLRKDARSAKTTRAREKHRPPRPPRTDKSAAKASLQPRALTYTQIKAAAEHAVARSKPYQ